MRPMAQHRFVGRGFLTCVPRSDGVLDSTTYTVFHNHLTIHSTEMYWPFSRYHASIGDVTTNRTCPLPSWSLAWREQTITDKRITGGDEDRKGNATGAVLGRGLGVKGDAG